MNSFQNLSNLILSSKTYFPPQKGKKTQIKKGYQNTKDNNSLKQCSLHNKFIKQKPNIQQQKQKFNSKKQNNRKFQPVVRHEQLFYEPQDSFTMIDSLQLNLQVERIDQTEPTKPIFLNYIGCCQEKKFNSQNFKCIATKNRQMFIHNLNSNQLQIYINFNTVQASITSNFWDSSCWNTMCSVKQQRKTNKSKKNLAWQHKYVILDFDGKLTLSFTSLDENHEILVQWGQYLKSIIQQSYGKIYNLSNLTQNQDFFKKKYKLERQFLDDCQTGDLLLFQGKNMMAKAQRFFTNSQFDHVGMVVRDKYYNILVFQTNGISGSCLTPWNMIISYEWYKTIDKYLLDNIRIVWRKLEGVERTFEFQKKIANFIKQNIKAKYHLSIKKLLSDKSYNGLEKNDEHGYFCSELIARIYKQMHFLPNSEKQPNYKPACQYLPYDFTQKAKLQLTNGTSLSGQYELLFDQVGIVNDNFQGIISNDNKLFKKKK